MSSLVLYELAGRDADLRFSPHCWKIRYALAHKGLAADCRPWRFTDKEAIAASGQGSVPVLADGDRVISDSWRIAGYLEDQYQDRPTLFGDPDAKALTQFINAWVDGTVVPTLIGLILTDIYAIIADQDRDYFRETREKRFGRKLEAVTGDLAAFRQALNPLRFIVKARPYIAGAAPAYADFAVMGLFMWARCTSPLALLETDDPVYAWRERMLDRFDGLGRKARCISD